MIPCHCQASCTLTLLCIFYSNRITSASTGAPIQDRCGSRHTKDSASLLQLGNQAFGFAFENFQAGDLSTEGSTQATIKPPKPPNPKYVMLQPQSQLVDLITKRLHLFSGLCIPEPPAANQKDEGFRSLHMQIVQASSFRANLFSLAWAASNSPRRSSPSGSSTNSPARKPTSFLISAPRLLFHV